MDTEDWLDWGIVVAALIVVLLVIIKTVRG